MSKPSGLDEEYDRRTEELSRSYHFYDQCAVTNTMWLCYAQTLLWSHVLRWSTVCRWNVNSDGIRNLRRYSPLHRLITLSRIGYVIHTILLQQSALRSRHETETKRWLTHKTSISSDILYLYPWIDRLISSVNMSCLTKQQL